VNGDDGLVVPADENPFASPAQDLPVAVAADDRYGRLAGRIFLVLGGLALLNMAYGMMHGRILIDFGAIAMLLIGRGLLRHSDSARRWGIGCAGTYLGLVAGGCLLIWWARSRPDPLPAEVPDGPLLVAFAAAASAIFAALLWLLLHPRTRAAYRTRA